MPANWTTLATVTAPLHGIIEYVDMNPPCRPPITGSNGRRLTLHNDSQRLQVVVHCAQRRYSV
jgi:hypothetical protein